VAVHIEPGLDPDPVPAEAHVGDVGRADAILSEVLRLVRLVERTRAHFATGPADGVEHAAYVLLAHLNCVGPVRASALAEAVHSDPSTISRQISGLVKAGLVERRPDPEDGRACLLAATSEGERVFEAKRRARRRHTAAMLTHWSPADRNQFVTLLDRFNTDFENYRPNILDAAAKHAAPARQGGPTS
jgi:DNA-binding MarR family transcriptional regulator